MLELASVLLLGIGAQWLAWKLRLPSILLLLLVGFVAGPFSGQRFLDPDHMLGESLLPLVSLAVALILLEGGLTLKFKELREAGSAVRNLVLIGSPVTFVLASVCARFGLGVDWGLAFLVGAILVEDSAGLGTSLDGHWTVGFSGCAVRDALAGLVIPHRLKHRSWANLY